jgi:hypothetical protein
MRKSIIQYAFTRVVLVGLGCVTATVLPTAAASPYSIKRTTASVSVRDSVPVAVVSSGPFDDAPGVLSDGLPRCYVATDGNGDPVWISVNKNSPLETVRIGFDDEDPWSAPVDPTLSTVAAAPSSVPADGVSEIAVTIVPRDADGVPLGTGLAVSVDTSALWPAFLVGTLSDNGDGSYTVRVASSIPGASEVWTLVEGVALDSEPTLTFEDTGEWDLREQAILRLEDLDAPGGLFDQLLDGLDPDQHAAKHLEKSREFVVKALDELYVWNDVVAVGDKLKKAADEMEKFLEQPGGLDPDAIQRLVDHLVDAARMLAVYHIAEAEATCGVCGQGGPNGVCEARSSTSTDRPWTRRSAPAASARPAPMSRLPAAAGDGSRLSRSA